MSSQCLPEGSQRSRIIQKRRTEKGGGGRERGLGKIISWHPPSREAQKDNKYINMPSCDLIHIHVLAMQFSVCFHSLRLRNSKKKSDQFFVQAGGIRL